MTEHHDAADVVVSNVPADATADEIEELYADAGPVRRVAIKRNGKAILHFVLATDAQRCLEDMGGRTLRGHTLSLSVHSVEEQAPTIKHEPVNTRLFRLIVRNLPFGVKEAAVRSVFQDFGRLVEVHLPTKIGPDGKPMGRGFGFLQYSSKKEAKEALERGNGIAVLGRPVAVDWALGKEFYEAVAGPAKPPAAPADAKRGAAAAEPGGADVGKAKRKPAAADVDKENSAAAAGNGAAAAKRQRVDGAGGDAADAAAAGAKAGKAGKGKRGEESADAADGSAAGAKAGKAGKGKRGEESADAAAAAAEPAETAAVFVRNVPLEATEEELAAVMRRFGRVKWCKLVMDKTTGRHRGTAFVHFLDPRAAHAAVRAGGAFTGSSEWEQVQRKKDRQNASHVKGLLHDEYVETLKMQGRHLFVALAVDKREAEQRAREGGERKDARNLYLAREGLILEDSPAAKTCSPADLNKRLRDWQDKKKKLANTNFFVSRTRLSVRNLSRDVTDAALRALFQDAAAAAAAARPASEREEGGPPRVVQARVVRDKERIDPDTGKGASKGYGFVEFEEHRDALAALRRLNNCPKAARASNGGKRLMVDFVVEDARVVRQRRIKLARKERLKLTRAGAKKEERAACGAADRPLGRGAKQRLKKRATAAPADSAAPGPAGPSKPRAAKPTAASAAAARKAARAQEAGTRAGRRVEGGTAAGRREGAEGGRRGEGRAAGGAEGAGAGRKRPAAGGADGAGDRARDGVVVAGGPRKAGRADAARRPQRPAAVGAVGAEGGPRKKARRGDGAGELEALVGDVDGVMRKGKGKQKRDAGRGPGGKGDSEAGLESLVARYSARLFGSGDGAKRWFE